MRTTIMAVLSSFVAACAPLGNPGGGGYDDGPDGGVDGGAVGGPCDDLVTKTMALNITGSAGFTGLPTTCWRLNGKLTLSGPAVTSVAKLGDLRGVTDLEIADTDLTSFDSKTQIDVSGDLYIHDNDKLTDIANVVPKPVIDSIRVEYNAALTGLGGVASAQTVSAQTSITNNAKLAVANLGSAQRLEGGLAVRDNLALTSLDIKSLQSAGSISIANNGALRTITASSSLTNIHGTLTVDNNDALVSLGSLGTSVQIDVGVLITNNGALTDVGGIDHADQILGGVQITGNTALSPSRAHDVGCCVPTGAFQTSNNKPNTQCDGNHWCLNTQDCYR